MRKFGVLYLVVSLSLVLTALLLCASQSTASPPAPAGAALAVDPDPYEPDDTCTQGTGIPVIGYDRHTFHTSTDVDWCGLDNLPAHHKISVIAATNGQSCLIEIYAPDCQTRLASGTGWVDLELGERTQVTVRFSAVGGWMDEYYTRFEIYRPWAVDGYVYRTGTSIGIPGVALELWMYASAGPPDQHGWHRRESGVTDAQGHVRFSGWWDIFCPGSDPFLYWAMSEVDPPGCTSTGAEAAPGYDVNVSPNFNRVDWTCHTSCGPCDNIVRFYDTPPLALGGASPMSGQSCPGQVQTFITSVTDVSTATRISQVEYVFDAGAWLQDAVHLRYDQAANTISLRNDAGSGWLGSGAPGSAQVLENSRVRVLLSQCHVGISADGRTLAVTWALAFKSDFAGSYNQFLYARHQSGYEQGFEDVGDWTVNYCSTPTPTLTPTITPTPPPGGSGEASFQQGVNGYDGCRDTSLDPWEPGRNHSGDGSLIVRANNSFSSLLRYELTSLPVYAVIDQATLSLYADSWQTTAESKATVAATALTVGVYEVLRDWTAGQATWANAMTGVPWGTAGCSSTTSDRAAAAADEALVNATGKWYEFDLTTLVQKWVQQPGTNHGLVLKSFSSPAGVVFRSSEHGGLQEHPKLLIEYTIPAAATATITATPTRTLTPTHWTHLPLLLKGR